MSSPRRETVQRFFDLLGKDLEAALALTRSTGFATFFSRTRNKLWMKGETSGNKLEVVETLVDCDDDTVLVKVIREGDGNVCHTGERTCFFRKL